MALRARKVAGAFEKRAPGQIFLPCSLAKLFSTFPFPVQLVNNSVFSQTKGVVRAKKVKKGKEDIIEAPLG